MTAPSNILAAFALFLVISHGATAVVLRTIFIGNRDSKQPMTAHQQLQGKIALAGLATTFLATATVIYPIVNPNHTPHGWIMVFLLTAANVTMVLVAA